jgi:hypothetical protein
MITSNRQMPPVDSELTRDSFLIFPATTLAALPVGLTSGPRLSQGGGLIAKSAVAVTVAAITIMIHDRPQ